LITLEKFHFMAGSRELIKALIPAQVRRWLRGKQCWLRHALLPFRKVRSFSRLRRLTPISKEFGWDRGLPIDRYYIEKFLQQSAPDIRGRVLEIQNPHYTHKFGGAQVAQSDVLDIDQNNQQASIIADLTSADHIPADTFDCIVCTQTLLLIYDLRAAIRTLYRILKPNGVLLVTIPGGSHQICRDEMQRVGDYWRFTSLSAQRLFEEAFQSGNVQVGTFGNVLTAIAFLHGLATRELRRDELDYHDPDYEVTITVRAVKSSATR
jgi:SAM-dependent methyltransferase